MGRSITAHLIPQTLQGTSYRQNFVSMENLALVFFYCCSSAAAAPGWEEKD